MAKLQTFIDNGFNPKEMQYNTSTQQQQTQQNTAEQQNQVSEQTQQQTQRTTGSQEQASQSESQQSTRKTLDSELVALILSGLQGYMTDEQRAAYAENLLLPQLNAGLEAAQQAYDTKALSTKQQQDEIKAQLELAIQNQQAAYQQNMSDVQNAALARGMGRSSYLLQTMAGQGTKLAETVRQLSDEAGRKSSDLGAQLAQAAEQNAQTQGRLKTDYASQLAAKIQELAETQRKEQNQNYLTAISSALGSDTRQQTQSASQATSLQDTTGTTTTNGTVQTNTTGNTNTNTVQDASSTALKMEYAPGDEGGGGNYDIESNNKRYGSVVGQV